MVIMPPSPAPKKISYNCRSQGWAHISPTESAPRPSFLTCWLVLQPGLTIPIPVLTLTGRYSILALPGMPPGIAFVYTSEWYSALVHANYPSSALPQGLELWSNPQKSLCFPLKISTSGWLNPSPTAWEQAPRASWFLQFQATGRPVGPSLQT